ncbi:hypothetical protein [Streptomyces sp. NBC_01235]|uniref:hypothetical protein n=1 Tax=Streptomyces sp. NBC_01235 TaxID=2903788 RepID=UPI002E1001E6|nr:hypothetical protein OG289_42220 [Streptomyces sp. NBC_01235]
MNQITTNPTVPVNASTSQTEVRPGTEQIDRLAAVLPAAIEQAMRTAVPELFSPELAAEFAKAMVAELRNPQQDQPAGCPVYPGLCTETEPGHYDHSGHDHSVTTKDGHHLLDVGFVQLSDGGPAIVYLGGMSHEDLLPDEVHAKTAELRRLLDVADGIADRLIAERDARA